jgi:hypothetical protein
MELPWDAALCTWLCQWEICRERACLSFSYQKHVPNGRNRISRSGWRLGQWDSYRPCGANLDVTEALLEEPISSLLSFKIVFEASSTAWGASVGLASLSVSSLAVEFRTLTGSHRPEIRTVFSLRNLYIYFSSNWLQIHTSKAGDIN